MRICAHHHSSWKRIVLQDDLMDYAGTRPPETDAVSCRRTLQKAIDFGVLAICLCEVRRCARTGPHKVVAMHCRRNRHTVPPGIHELQEGHLGRCVLHGNAVGTKVCIVHPTAVRRERTFVVKVSIKYLFGQRQRTSQHTAGFGHLTAIQGIKLFYFVEILNHAFSFFTGYTIVSAFTTAFLATVLNICFKPFFHTVARTEI